MRHNSGESPEAPNQAQQDYMNALAVIAEVSEVVVEDLVAEADKQSEAITRYYGVRLVRDVMRDADALTHYCAPQRAVDQAQHLTWKAAQETEKTPALSA